MVDAGFTAMAGAIAQLAGAQALGFLSIYSGYELAFAIAVAIAAGIIRGYAGFGSGLVMVPLLALMWGPVEALATTITIGLAATVQLVPQALTFSNWRDTGPMSAATLVLAPVGTATLVSLDPSIAKKLIAILVLGLSLITLYGWSYKGPRNAGASAIAGAIGGFINGLAGIGGPPLVLYLISLPEKPEVHRANIVIVLAVTSLISIVSLFVAGAITQRVLTHTAILIVPSIVSVWAGAKLFAILPGTAFRIIVLWFLIAISLAILFA